MLNNYLKFALRNVLKNKIYSLINVIGLALGLASSFIILLYVMHELSYDRYNKKLDKIFLLTTTKKEFNATETETPFMLGPILKEQYPEIIRYARWVVRRKPVRYKDKIFTNSQCVFADRDLFNILTLPIERGSLREFRANENSVIISEGMAKKYFGNLNPLGQILSVQDDDSYDVKVAGVMKEIPETSTFKADLILPISLAEKSLIKRWSNVEKNPLESRDLNIVTTYILLNKTSNAPDLGKKLKNFSKVYSDPNHEYQFHLFSIKDIYFYSTGLVNNSFPLGNINNVYIYSIIGFLILLIACINIIMLNTGRANTRTKEIGVRKVIGASRFNLIKQILIETLLILFISLFIAVVLVEIFFSDLTSLLGKELQTNYLYNWQYLLLIIGVTIIVGLFSGGYISFYLSGFQPVDILRNKMIVGSGKSIFRKFLITVQMIIFIGLIIALLTINKQISYFKDKDLGFDKNNLVVFYDDNGITENNFSAFKNELKANPNIIGVTGGYIIPATQSYAVFLQKNELDPSKKVLVQTLMVDKDFFEVMGMKIKLGRSFAELSPNEANNTCVLNETVLKELSIKDPIGDMLGSWRIIGVVKDFNLHSLRKKISATVIWKVDNSIPLHEIVVKTRKTEITKTIDFIRKKSKEFNNGRQMSYDFFNQRIDGLYGNENKFAQMIDYFTIIAIIIACLGLFGMSLFVSQQKVKEIGIRKVMGASTSNIFYILTKEFIVLTITSAIIAAPISIYFTDKWLQNFAYRVHFGFSIFFTAGVITILIVMLTISFQTIKAAVSKPVDSLRYE